MKVKDLKAFTDRFYALREYENEVVLYNDGTDYSPHWRPLDPTKIKVEVKPIIQLETSEAKETSEEEE